MRDNGSWRENPQIAEQLAEARAQYRANSPATLDDFYAYMPSHQYIYTPIGALWPAASVNSQIAPIPLIDEHGVPLRDEKDKQRYISPSTWLDQNRPVQQMTWVPGEPMAINGRLLVGEGGWIERPGATMFNLYRPPIVEPGDPKAAAQWVEHVRRIYPDEADHILDWLAHRVQRPGEKINHALVLGGAQGIGKDTLLEPVRRAIGSWNCAEVSPGQVMGRFNGFLKSVILRISEARDLGDSDRFKFYDHMKTYIAAPPDVLRVDEKHLREYPILNCCSVIFTTNNRTDGIYLPADDRRHFVAWSVKTKEDFAEAYWPSLWKYYEAEGFRAVAANLRQRDISRFNPKAPPPTTQAFWAIVDANRAPQEAELGDVFDSLGNPDVVTLRQLQDNAQLAYPDLHDWLKDVKNRRAIPHRLETCGYMRVRNPTAPKEGDWKIEGKRQVIYAKSTLTLQGQIAAATKLADGR